MGRPGAPCRQRCRHRLPVDRQAAHRGVGALALQQTSYSAQTCTCHSGRGRSECSGAASAAPAAIPTRVTRYRMSRSMYPRFSCAGAHQTPKTRAGRAGPDRDAGSVGGGRRCVPIWRESERRPGPQGAAEVRRLDPGSRVRTGTGAAGTGRDVLHAQVEPRNVRRTARRSGAQRDVPDDPAQVSLDFIFDILDWFLPVTVEAITTSTAATRTATSQRTQSTPDVVPPPNAV